MTDVKRSRELSDPASRGAPSLRATSARTVTVTFAERRSKTMKTKERLDRINRIICSSKFFDFSEEGQKALLTERARLEAERDSRKE